MGVWLAEDLGGCVASAGVLADRNQLLAYPGSWRSRLLAKDHGGTEDRLLAEGRDFGAADRLHVEDRRNCRWCPKLLDTSKLDAWLAFWALRQESGDARTCY